MKTTKIKGLSANEVLESRQKYGANVMTPPAKRSLLSRFVEKFRDPLITILLIAGVLSIILSCVELIMGKDWHVFIEPIGIFLAIFLSIGLAFFFEIKADKDFTILNQVNDDETVIVLRDGKRVSIPKKDVVVGDVVYINTGDEIPADGTLLRANELKIDESSLTGETICNKTIDPNLFDSKATYPSNEVLRGTKVMEGYGVFAVTKVGDTTENGKVFVEAQIDNSVKTPLNEQLEKLSNWITYTSYILAGLIIIGRCLMFFHTDAGWLVLNTLDEWVDFALYFLQSIMIAVTLIVVAVPEGLPMAVTLSLAYSMRAMLKTNNLVRRMHACETMGAVTVICTDKTGTLTQNKMQVAETAFVDYESNHQLINETISVNSTATIDGDNVIGNPTEGALLLWLQKQHVDYLSIRENTEILQELPFSTERKYMAVVVRSFNGKRMLYLKGAPEIVYSFCKQNEAEKEHLQELLSQYQHRAMRTLAFACKELNEDENPFTQHRLAVDNLTYQGVVGISDPVREDVPAAVAECHKAGIRVIIVTGDSPCTAMEIGRNIGIWKDDDTEECIIEGTDFAALSDEALSQRLGKLKIVARARPTDKKRLVEALQQQNEVVAVTGDGTNDAPAIKAAHVGLSMGAGTSVAKEASDITIIDNSFASIGRAVMWGRSLYNNIQRFILFQMTVNVAACLVVLAGAFMGKESPLTVTQMLWVNLIMDTFAAMALASLPPSKEVMQKAPRNRNANIISRRMFWQITLFGGFICLLMIGFVWVLEHLDIQPESEYLIFEAIRTGTWHFDGLSPYELSIFFTTFVMIQFWNLFNAKAFESQHLAWVHLKDIKSHANFFVIIGVILFGQIVIVNFGGEFFGVQSLSLQDWVIIISGTSLVSIFGELTRWMKSLIRNVN